MTKGGVLGPLPFDPETLTKYAKRRRLYTARTAERVDVFDDEEALFAEIEGKPLPQAEMPQEIYRTGTGTGKVENEDKDWIQKQRQSNESS